MAEPTFTRAGTTQLFWSSEPALSRRLLFLATAAGSATQLTLTQSWSDAAGVYVMFGAALPSDGNDPQRQQAIQTFLAWRSWPTSGTRILWVDTRADATGLNPFQWSALALDCAGTSPFTLRHSVDISIQGYFVSCGSGSTLALSGDASGFTISGTATLVVPGGTYPAVGGQVTVPMGGANAACWQFDLLLTQGDGTPGGSDFDRFGVGLRYCAPGPDSGVSVLHLPVLRQPTGTNVPLHALIDPLHLLDPARTRLSLLPAPTVQMQSNFVTARGHQVDLTPSNAGTRPAGFVFALQPLLSGEPDTVPTCCYLTLDGHFTINIALPLAASALPMEQLLCGTSGLEYLGIPSGTAFELVFVPGKAAFAVGSDATVGGAPPLSRAGTTAWLYLSTGGTTGTYFSQPDRAPLFSNPTQGFLSYLELPSATLPASDEVRSFPMAPYLGIAAADADLARRIESQALAPQRQALIASLNPATNSAAADAAETIAVTPQGVAVALNAADPLSWRWVGVAKQRASETLPDLRFTQVTGLFKQAMQANRLFMVMTDADVVMGPIPRAATVVPPASISYCLTTDAIAQLRANPPSGLTPAMIDAVARALSGVVKTTENDFLAALLLAVPGLAPAFQRVFLRLAGALIAEIDQWRFQLSPRNWSAPDRPADQHSVFIVKLTADRTLAECTRDPGSWAWSDAARIDGRLSNTTDLLAKILADAQEAYDADPTPGNPYSHFVTTVMGDRNWCGFIVLNCDVPLASLPDALRPLEIGIDPTRFRAHHWGVDLTGFKVDGSQLTFERSALFALIDYEDPEDQLLEQTVDFAFKVLRLSVGFRNSMVASFSSRVELMINRLFGARTRLYPTDHGNNLILDGSYQQQLGADGLPHASYLFSARDKGVYQIDASALRSVEVLGAQFAANPAAGGATGPVSGIFQIRGNLRFWHNRQFDAFSFGASEVPEETIEPAQVAEEMSNWEIIDTPYGQARLIPGSQIGAEESVESRRAERDAARAASAPLDPAGDLALAPPLDTPLDPPPDPPAVVDGYLTFSDLRISMSFDPLTRVPTFRLSTENIAFDLSLSRARVDSLSNRFPVALRHLIAAPDPPASGAQAAGLDPSDLGYVSITAQGLQQNRLKTPWYGLEYELNLGSLGALTSSAGLVMTILAAWSAGGTDKEPYVYLGVKMPGMKDAIGVELPLQGVFKLGFRSIELATYPAPGTEGGLAYLMRLRNFGLQILGLTLPPGRNDILLFGSPDQAGATTLGWYAAYAAESDEKKKPPRALR